MRLWQTACFVFPGHVPFLLPRFPKGQHKSSALPEPPRRHVSKLSCSSHQPSEDTLFRNQHFRPSHIVLCRLSSQIGTQFAFVLLTDVIKLPKLSPTIDHPFSHYSASIPISSTSLGLCLTSTVCHPTCVLSLRATLWPCQRP
jgi:hypothetical protein